MSGSRQNRILSCVSVKRALSDVSWRNVINYKRQDEVIWKSFRWMTFGRKYVTNSEFWQKHFLNSSCVEGRMYTGIVLSFVLRKRLVGNGSVSVSCRMASLKVLNFQVMFPGNCFVCFREAWVSGKVLGSFKRLGSNLVRVTNSPYFSFSWFFWTPPGIFCDSTSTTPRAVSFKITSNDPTNNLENGYDKFTIKNSLLCM
jgi:hypothetical protein